MKKINTGFEGLFLLETNNFTDNRGGFQKLFNFDFFIENNLDTDFKEFYYSVSEKNVIRGMHFQLPPFDHTKLVYVSKGSIMDVVVDLRKQSKTYQHTFNVELNDNEAKYLYIPKGFAHGFLSLEEGSIVNDADYGIAYNSFGFDWMVQNPIVSQRDMNFEKFESFKSPF